MNFFLKLLGMHYPDPQVGQIWESGYNGDRFEITEVRVSREGLLIVGATDIAEDGSFRMPYPFAHQLSGWRQALRDQNARRVK